LAYNYRNFCYKLPTYISATQSTFPSTTFTHIQLALDSTYTSAHMSCLFFNLLSSSSVDAWFSSFSFFPLDLMTVLLLHFLFDFLGSSSSSSELELLLRDCLFLVLGWLFSEIILVLSCCLVEVDATSYTLRDLKRLGDGPDSTFFELVEAASTFLETSCVDLFSFLVFLPLFNDNSGHPPRLIVRAHS